MNFLTNGLDLLSLLQMSLTTVQAKDKGKEAFMSQEIFITTIKMINSFDR